MISTKKEVLIIAYIMGVTSIVLTAITYMLFVPPIREVITIFLAFIGTFTTIALFWYGFHLLTKE